MPPYRQPQHLENNRLDRSSYLNDHFSQSAHDFMQSGTQLGPTLAVFDCDGTLWSGDAGERFFDWELKRGVLSDEITRWVRQRYADYKAGKVSEDDMCGEMVTIHRGLREDEILRLAREFFEEN